MFGSDALLDSAGSGNEVHCIQGVLQRISNPSGSARTNANRNADIETHRLQLIPLAETLSRPVSDTNGSSARIRQGQVGSDLPYQFAAFLAHEYIHANGEVRESPAS